VRYSEGNARAHGILAGHYMRKGDYQNARQEAGRVLQLEPLNIQAALILGQSLLYLQDTDRALEIFEQMKIHLPDNIDVLFNLALTRIARQEFGPAEDLFELILTLQPDHTPALAQIAELYIRRDETDKALARAREQMDKAPGVPEHMLLTGELLLRGGNTAEAVDQFRQVQQIAPENPRSYINMAEVLKTSGELDMAIGQYRDLLSRQQDSVQTLMGLAVLLEQASETAEAKKHYQRILTINPHFAPAANNLAWLLAGENNPDLGEALRFAQLAKEKQGANPKISDTLGYIFYKRGAYDLAVAQFRHAASLLPHIPTVQYHLALALKAHGANEEALEKLEQCLAQEADFPERAEAQKLSGAWREALAQDI
jgi:tetratricopeptide (TPR) repeat protein